MKRVCGLEFAMYCNNLQGRGVLLKFTPSEQHNYGVARMQGELKSCSIMRNGEVVWKMQLQGEQYLVGNSWRHTKETLVTLFCDNGTRKAVARCTYVDGADYVFWVDEAYKQEHKGGCALII